MSAAARQQRHDLHIITVDIRLERHIVLLAQPEFLCVPCSPPSPPGPPFQAATNVKVSPAGNGGVKVDVTTPPVPGPATDVNVNVPGVSVL